MAPVGGVRPSWAQPSKTKLRSSSSSQTKTTSGASLVQTSAQKSLRSANTLFQTNHHNKSKSKSKNKVNKFRDSEQRDLLDAQTAHLLASTQANSPAESDQAEPFKYKLPSREEQRQTRAHLDQTAHAFELLMK